MKRVLAIWLPNWPIQRLAVARPELRCRPVILFRRDSRRGQLVAACSPAAKRLGVRIEMPLSEAKSLALHANARQTASSVKSGSPLAVKGTYSNQQTDHPPTDPEAFTIEVHDPPADRAALETLAESCDQFSPIVGLEETEQPSSIFLDVTGLAHLFGGYPKLADEVAAHCQRLGYYARICIANTIGAAWGVTHFARYQVTKPIPQSPNPANLSADSMPIALPCPPLPCLGLIKSEPTALATGVDNAVNQARRTETNACGSPNVSSGLPCPELPCPELLEPSDQQSWQQLPVAALRLETNTLETLYQLGIERIAQLLVLPRASLSSRLGDQILQRLDQMSGAVEEIITAHQPPAEFEASQLLEFPTHHRDTIDFILWQKVQELCRQLSARQRGAISLLCRFTCENHQPAAIRVGLFQPTAVARHLIELICMQLDRLALPAAVQSIRVQVTLSAPLVQLQRQLFEQSALHDWQLQAQLVNRLSSRLGAESVIRPHLQANAQPEYAVRYQKLTGQSPQTLKRAATRSKRRQNKRTEERQNANRTHRNRQSKSQDRSTPLPSPFQRPLLLHSTPIVLPTISLSSSFSSASPADKPGADLGPPAAFHYRQQRFQVVQHWGPERIETGWWRGPMTSRDYYRIETDSGQRFWIFKNLRDKQWYLHGEF